MSIEAHAARIAELGAEMAAARRRFVAAAPLRDAWWESLREPDDARRHALLAYAMGRSPTYPERTAA